VGPDGEPTGIKLPYIVTVEENSREILSVKRNYEENNPKKNKIQYFVHFKFLPGLGFYGFGLIHMIWWIISNCYFCFKAVTRCRYLV
jgi:hypothetical protein